MPSMAFRDVFNGFVNDRIQPNIHFFIFSDLGRLWSRSYAEADDNRLRSACEHDVRFGDASYSGVNDFHLDIRGRNPDQRFLHRFYRALDVCLHDEVKLLDLLFLHARQ